ncbi:MAG: tetratricopeptide repeat protein [Xanthomonadales bacterium]|nr:tetratricopeptide repeat protein [Xanthomonadales bacterium]
MSFLGELKRRNVLRVGAAYIVTAWLVVQVVETLFPVYGLSDGAIRLVVNILAIGLLPVLVLAWVFEWTPEGLKKDSDVEAGAPASLAAAKRLDRIILIVLVLALGYFATDKFVLDPQREARQAQLQQAELEQAREQGIAEGLQQSRGDASIAVLAFADLSPDGGQDYLGDGIAEDILNLLQRMPQLDVRSRTSSFRFKDKDVSVPEIAELLDVDHVLEGSVRRIGERIRITAQLIDARTDSHLWSDNFDRNVEDVFAIMDEISLAAAEQVGIELLSEPPRAERINADAYFHYLRGHHLVQGVDSAAAVDYFEQALEIEPEYIDAMLGMSMAYWNLMPDYAELEEDKHEYQRLSEQFAARAKALDPEHPVILAWDGFDAMSAGDFAGAADLMSTALSRDAANWDVVQSSIIFSLAIRRNELAVALAEGAVRRDPYCAMCSYWLGRTLNRVERYAHAERAMLEFWRKVPAARDGQFTLATSLMMQGKYDEARSHFQQWGERGQSDAWWGLIMIRVLQGEDVTAELDRL